MAFKVAAIASLACLAAVTFMPAAFLPFCPSAAPPGVDIPRATGASPHLQDSGEPAARPLGVVVAAVAVGFLVGLVGAPAAKAMPTGIVETNELWHSHDGKAAHWISFDKRMEIAADKDVKELDLYIQDRLLMKEARANAETLKQQRVANYKNKVTLEDKIFADPEFHDMLPPTRYTPPTLAGGPIRIPYLNSEMDLDADF